MIDYTVGPSPYDFLTHYRKLCRTSTPAIQTRYTPIVRQCMLMSEVETLAQLLLVMPATNATSERSFSALRRVKALHHVTETTYSPDAAPRRQGQDTADASCCKGLRRTI